GSTNSDELRPWTVSAVRPVVATLRDEQPEELVTLPPRECAEARRFDAEIPRVAFRELPDVQHAHLTTVAHWDVNAARNRYAVARLEISRFARNGFSAGTFDEDRVMTGHANRAAVARVNDEAALSRRMRDQRRRPGGNHLSVGGEGRHAEVFERILERRRELVEDREAARLPLRYVCRCDRV